MARASWILVATEVSDLFCAAVREREREIKRERFKLNGIRDRNKNYRGRNYTAKVFISAYSFCVIYVC